LNLIDHLNAEIGLGTVTSISTAKEWLTSTFLFVRLRANPEHYRIDGDEPDHSLDDRLERICAKYVSQLQEIDLVKTSAALECTEFGEAMARYSLKFETMKIFLTLPTKAKISEILSAIASASEFKEIRFRPGEKPIYRAVNKNAGMKFPIPVNVESSAHKILLIVQCVLGALDLDTEDSKHRQEFLLCKSTIFSHATRLIRCIIDCRLVLRDSVGARNALMLARSFGAQAWDDSPLHMAQLKDIGIGLVRRLVAANIKSIEDLCQIEPHKIESAVSRHPPFGTVIQVRSYAFPNPRLSLKVVGDPQVKKGLHVAVKVKAEIGFTNEKTPEMFNRKPVNVCLLVERSDGDLIHFVRVAARRLANGQDILFTAELTSPEQTLRGFVMCDDIAATQRSVIIKPKIPAFMFPVPRLQDEYHQIYNSASNSQRAQTDQQSSTQKEVKRSDRVEDLFDDDSIDDADLVLAETRGFAHIDQYESNDERENTQRVQANVKNSTQARETQKMSNGRWACNHACKDKSKCKHLCCRDGLDKPPKPAKQKTNKQDHTSPDPKQTQLTMSVSKAKSQSLTNEIPRLKGKGLASERKWAEEAVDLSEPSEPFGDRVHQNTQHHNRSRDHHQLTERSSAKHDTIENMTISSESDYGSEFLDFDSLPDAVSIAKPAGITPTGFSAGGPQRSSHLGQRTQVEAPSGGKGPTSEGDAADRDGGSVLNSDIPYDTTMSVKDSSKQRSLFVYTSDATEEALPDEKNSNGKRRNSDDLVGLDENEFKSMMPPTKKPAFQRSVIEADEFMMSVNQDIASERNTVEPDDIYEWFAENFGFEHFNWVG
jgi:ATP-dependent DNA helicase HFM1/MER3